MLTSEDVIVRKLTAQDAGAVYAIESRCFAMPWTERQCLAAFAQKAFLAYGVFQSTGLLAYVTFYHVIDEFEILNIAVLPEFRRMGIARHLLLTTLQEAKKMAIQSIGLEVRVTNAPAIGLYENCGFVRTGVRPHYYPDTGEDALLYQRRVSGS